MAKLIICDKMKNPKYFGNIENNYSTNFPK